VDNVLQHELNNVCAEDQEHCDKAIVCSEIKQAINRKSSGQDGLTVECYCSLYFEERDEYTYLYKG
jgi:hypothetical protein